MCAGRVYTFPKILLVNIIFENLYYGVTSPKRRLLQNTTFSSVMCGSTMSSARPLTIVVTFFHLPGWHQGLVFLTMRVDAERLQSPIIHSASPPPPPQICINCCFPNSPGRTVFLENNTIIYQIWVANRQTVLEEIRKWSIGYI